MFVGKFRIRHDDWILDKTVRYNVSAYGVPLSSYVKKGVQYHSGMIMLEGSEEGVRRFVEAVKKDTRAKKVEYYPPSLYVLLEGNDTITTYFDRSLFLLKPVFFKEGYEYWEVGCFERKPLITFFEKIKAVAEVKMLKIGKEKPQAMFYHSVPMLTLKQYEALFCAIQEGYYRYPREKSVEEMAMIMKVPRSTFQEHLRKAESKVMPQFQAHAGAIKKKK